MAPRLEVLPCPSKLPILKSASSRQHFAASWNGSIRLPPRTATRSRHLCANSWGPRAYAIPW